MRTLGDITRKIRSKNAGPFTLTIDIFCDIEEVYNEVVRILTLEKVSQLYKTPKRKIKLFLISDLKIMKITFPRPEIQGSNIDRDLHGASFSIILEELILGET